MEFWIAVLIVVLLVRWRVLSSRLRGIKQQLEHEATRRNSAEREIAELKQRLHAVETASVGVIAAPPIPPPVAVTNAPPPPIPEEIRIPPPSIEPPAAAPVKPPPLPQPAPEPVVEPQPVFASAALRHEEAGREEAPPVPTESWHDTLRKKVGDQEWEAMVGGNWLNKAGVLAIVIGIALLLGYSFTRVGPAGRVAIGMGVSLAMLIGGVLVERQPLYRIFARGLIGGGWAALYFTTYAMHGVPAARIIESPFLGTSLLLAVALGMILHSLRYRSQTVSGLAYFIAFTTLALAESTPFSVLALIPLAGSLLVLAYRFDWYVMAVFGLGTTYATCASRPDTGALLESTQALFACYWLLFETFDLMRVRRRSFPETRATTEGRGSWPPMQGGHGLLRRSLAMRPEFTIESLILPLNAVGFLGLSLVKWYRAAPEYLYMFLAAAAGLYLASAILRASISPPTLRTEGHAEGTSTIERMAAGGFEGPITLAAALAAWSIFRKAPGMWINAGLLIEGEILFLAGLRFGQTYLRQLAGAVFGASLIKMLGVDVPAGGSMQITAREYFRWTPAAALTTVVFYLNRLMRISEGAMYSSAAAALVTLILGYETPQLYVGAAWLIFATLLFELGLRSEKTEFFIQSYTVGTLGTITGLFVNVLAGDAKWVHQWMPIAIAAALHYVVALRIRFSRAAIFGGEAAAWITSASATAFLAALAWKLTPSGYLGIAWMILGAILFELGLWKLPQQFRKLSYAVSAAGFWHLAYFHIVLVRKDSVPAEAISLGLATLLCCAMCARVFRPMPDRIEDAERAAGRDLYAAAGALFLMTLMWLKLPAPVVALAWGIVSLVLLEIGFSFSLARFRLLGNAATASVFVRLFLANFTDLGDTLHISHRLLTVAPIVISQYYVWWRYRHFEVHDWERTLVRLYLYAPAILGVVLARFELGRSLAVVGWALFGLALYRFGLSRGLSDLRWQSYAIAVLAFWRCWNTNFYIPESFAGIRGRILTGAIVIASFYCAQLISPRESNEDAHGRIDRYSRMFYSLLASVLLAVLLFYEVSGGVLTVAWGLEALALLGAGFPLRDRIQRLSGLFLFLVCVLKLFLYDLRQLETINRIISFIVLGVILMSVSWIYTRFRDRIQRYL